MSKLRYWAGGFLMAIGIMLLVVFIFAAAERWVTDIDPAVLDKVIPATSVLACYFALEHRHKQHKEELERRKKAETHRPSGTMSGPGGDG